MKMCQENPNVVEIGHFPWTLHCCRWH